MSSPKGLYDDKLTELRNAHKKYSTSVEVRAKMVKKIETDLREAKAGLKWSSDLRDDAKSGLRQAKSDLRAAKRHYWALQWLSALNFMSAWPSTVSRPHQSASQMDRAVAQDKDILRETKDAQKSVEQARASVNQYRDLLAAAPKAEESARAAIVANKRLLADMKAKLRMSRENLHDIERELRETERLSRLL